VIWQITTCARPSPECAIFCGRIIAEESIAGIESQVAGLDESSGSCITTNWRRPKNDICSNSHKI